MILEQFLKNIIAVYVNLFFKRYWKHYLILPVNKPVLYEYELVAVNMSQETQVVNVSIVLFISSEV